jgi:hypothetical protein
MGECQVKCGDESEICGRKIVGWACAARTTGAGEPVSPSTPPPSIYPSTRPCRVQASFFGRKRPEHATKIGPSTLQETARCVHGSSSASWWSIVAQFSATVPTRRWRSAAWRTSS